MRKIKLIIAALLVLSPFAANAVLITTTIGTYDVTTQVGIDMATWEAQPWWDSNSLAFEFSDLVNNQLGFPNGLFGPKFAYDLTLTGSAAWREVFPAGPPRTVNVSWLPADDTFAIASEVSVPEPSTLALLSLGLAGLGFTRRKAKTKRRA